MITVIDLKIGNINSVSRALTHIGVRHRVVDKAEELSQSKKIIFPGVGNFAEAVKRMRVLKVDNILKKLVLDNSIPILGICLGMQLFASYGEEGEKQKGLGFIKGRVIYLRASNIGLRMPHIGWNDVDFNESSLFHGINNHSCFYFAHGYEFIPDENVSIGHTNYGIDFVSVVQKAHIIGTQFHPEKSQKIGLKLLSNFCEGRF